MWGRWLAMLLLASSAALCCGISGMRFRTPGQNGGASQLQFRGRRGNGLAINVSARNYSSSAFAAPELLPTELSFAERMAAGGIARAVSMALKAFSKWPIAWNT